jgi:hypothetical protein
MRGTEPNVAAWQTHLDHFIPAQVVASSKTVVVIDRSSKTGDSIRKASALLTNYLAGKGSAAQVTPLSFDRHPEHGLPRVDITASAELTDMMLYSCWAEYGRCVVGSAAPSTFARRAEYDQFRQALAQRMSRDAELSTALRQFIGTPSPADVAPTTGN